MAALGLSLWHGGAGGKGPGSPVAMQLAAWIAAWIALEAAVGKTMQGVHRHRRTRLWLVAGFAVALALVAMFAVRLLHSAAGWETATPSDPTIAAWMTPRYVVHAWHVPPEVVAGAIAIGQDGTGRRMTLEEIAQAEGVTPDVLAARIEAAILAFRAGH